MFVFQRSTSTGLYWRRGWLVTGLLRVWNSGLPAHSVDKIYALHTGSWHCAGNDPRRHVHNPSRWLHTVVHNTITHVQSTNPPRYLHMSNQPPASTDLIEASDEETKCILQKDMLVYEDFISQEEENFLYEEVEPYLRRLRYEFDHWDNAIHGYRETEKRNWSQRSSAILKRVHELAFPPGAAQLAFVHVLDLAKTGYIKPHIDSVRFCGGTIAGISLLSDSVMRLVHDKNKSCCADILLRKRSLYIMKGPARYEYTHEILTEAESKFCGSPVPRERRISVICRCETELDNTGDNT